MRVGILTLKLRSNYGGLLQAYALQKALDSLGHEVHVIRHDGLKNRNAKQIISGWVPGFLPVKLRNGEWCLLATRRRAHRAVAKNMEAFVENHIRLTKKKYHNGNLVDLNKAGFDAIIVGSDQIWRPEYAGDIRACFLNFIQGEKICRLAYAASFGASEWEYTDVETSECAQLLASFRAVSVRERNAIAWCERKLNSDAQLVVDPTILLGSAHYEKFITNSKNEPYLCTYILDPTQEFDQKINDHISGRGLHRISPMPKCQYVDVGDADLAQCIYPTMEHWLSTFYHADKVITDSFHGTVFSVLFNKPFLSICNEKRGASRFQSFLGELGLTDCLVGSVDEFSAKVENFPAIDWPTVNRKLEDWRQRSFSFLQSNLFESQ